MKVDDVVVQIGAIYSHLNGLEYLKVHKMNVWEDILEVIANVDAEKCKTKVSQEKKTIGEVLYSPDRINEKFKEFLKQKGWQEERQTYYVTDDEKITQKILYLQPDEQKSIIEENKKPAYKSYNQTDFLKDRTAIEVQFGKYSFVAFDIFVKHLGFYVAGKIDVGIEILPTKKLQNHMSSGPSYYERELQHVIRQGRGNPAVPLILIGVEHVEGIQRNEQTLNDEFVDVSYIRKD